MNTGRMIRGYLAVILSAVLYGCMPLMAKLIYADGVNQFTLVFLRNFLALPVVGVMAYMQNKTLKLPKKMLPKVCLTSMLGSCITPILLSRTCRSSVCRTRSTAKRSWLASF